MRERIFELWKQWDDAEASRIAAPNLLLDIPAPQRRMDIINLQGRVGECSTAGPVLAEDWLRGHFDLSCSNGTVRTSFTLAPTQPPSVQYLSFQKMQLGLPPVAPGARPPGGVSCAE
jgi:hypothetical protein